MNTDNQTIYDDPKNLKREEKPDYAITKEYLAK